MLTALVVVLLVLVVVLGGLGWLAFAAWRHQQTLAPVVPPTTLTAPTMTTLRLCSGTGQEIARVRMPVNHRRVSYRHKTADGVDVYVATAYDGDAVWTYRRVGIERTH